MQALACIKLMEEDRLALRQVVCEVLQHSVRSHQLHIPVNNFSKTLNQKAATFVTLYYQQALQGCIGSTVARLPLWRDVAERTFSSAFSDSRFSAVTESQLADITFTISILSAIRPLEVSSEASLLEKLNHHKPGLIIQEGSRGALFLPGVWDSFSTPKKFLNALKIKAGLPAECWSPQIQVKYFEVSSVFGKYRTVS